MNGKENDHGKEFAGKLANRYDELSLVRKPNEVKILEITMIIQYERYLRL